MIPRKLSPQHHNITNAMRMAHLLKNESGIASFIHVGKSPRNVVFKAYPGL
jgi:hypothetical protein